ncbi:MAG: succinyl-diaminopimelate desuccinylase [Pseudomonadota bacterium]|nr:succinyl-diaminopimelate desuccinylase [Pseudomonadota bacterium]
MTLDALEFARALIKCPSVTPQDNGAQRLLVKTLENIGFKCDQVCFSEPGSEEVNNVYARFGDQSPNFCFAGHTDVVPVGETHSWTDDPFGAVIRDDILYGRGAADMKAAIACFASAASRFIASKNGDFSGSISFLITGDEEGPAINGTKKLLEWVTSRGEVLDACVVGEPTNPNKMGEMIKIGRRGSLNGNLVVHGIQGHTAYPHLAENPIHLAAEMIRAVTSKKIDSGSEYFQESTIQFSTIDVGNQASNVIPGSVNIRFNVRFNDLHRSSDIERWLRDKFDDVSKSSNCHYDLKIKVSGESFITSPGRLSDLLVNAVSEITGLTPEISTSGGTSDARFIKDYCEVAEFGMVGKTMHKTDESINIVDLEVLKNVYLHLLEAYFSDNPKVISD